MGMVGPCAFAASTRSLYLAEWLRSTLVETCNSNEYVLSVSTVGVVGFTSPTGEERLDDELGLGTFGLGPSLVHDAFHREIAALLHW